jgi:t-SNARE complex subunit (syntaxin)
MRLACREDAMYEHGARKTDTRIRRQMRRNRENRARVLLYTVAIWAFIFGVLFGMLLGINMMTGGN